MQLKRYTKSALFLAGVLVASSAPLASSAQNREKERSLADVVRTPRLANTPSDEVTKDETGKKERSLADVVATPRLANTPSDEDKGDADAVRTDQGDKPFNPAMYSNLLKYEWRGHFHQYYAGVDHSYDMVVTFLSVQNGKYTCHEFYPELGTTRESTGHINTDILVSEGSHRISGPEWHTIGGRPYHQVYHKMVLAYVEENNVKILAGHITLEDGTNVSEVVLKAFPKESTEEKYQEEKDSGVTKTPNIPMVEKRTAAAAVIPHADYLRPRHRRTHKTVPISTTRLPVKPEPQDVPKVAETQIVPKYPLKPYDKAEEARRREAQQQEAQQGSNLRWWITLGVTLASGTYIGSRFTNSKKSKG